MEMELLVNMILTAWNSHNKRLEALAAKLTEEQLQAPVAPGRNRGIYLLGHLAAVNDMMLTLLGLGPQLRPDLQKVFVSEADGTAELPKAEEVKKYLADVNAALAAGFAKLTADNWLEKHTAVNDEDFKKEPHRNKLNIIISRTNHLNYHLGQLALLQSKN